MGYVRYMKVVSLDFSADRVEDKFLIISISKRHAAESKSMKFKYETERDISRYDIVYK